MSSGSTKAVTGHLGPRRDEVFDALFELERSFRINMLRDNVSYESPVNFVYASTAPRHRWFPYKEGFSPAFVRSVFDEAGIQTGSVVCDPFSGVGSTVLTASLQGVESFGIEVSPLAHFIAKTKVVSFSEVDSDNLNVAFSVLDNYKEMPRAAPPANETVRGYFQKEILTAILEVKSLIDNLSPQVSSLVKLALLAKIEDFSTHRRAGNGVKRKARIQPKLGLRDARKFVFAGVAEKLHVMRQDLLETQKLKTPSLVLGSAMDPTVFSEVSAIDCVVTSPPYPNCFDYSKIYQRELWIGDFVADASDIAAFRNASLQSHVHSSWSRENSEVGSAIVNELIAPYLESQKLWSNRIPEMLRSYFRDLSLTLRHLSTKLREGASCSFVVGNSHYADVPVPTDLLLASLAESLGFSVDRIDVYRKIVPSSQYIRTESSLVWARESNVVLKKS